MSDLDSRLAEMPPEKRALFELALAKRRAAGAAAATPDEASVAAGMAAIPRRPPGIEIPLSVDQERLWFIQQVNLASPAYNVYGADRFRGPLSVPTFAAALAGVVARHEVLRTTFPAGLDGRPLQVVAPHLPVSVPLVDLSALPGDLREAEAQRVAKHQVNRPFRLTALPLFRLILIRMSAEDHIAPIAIHHIITDWVSYYTMQSELARLYEALRHGEPSLLPRPAFQFPDFAVWQRGYLADGKVYGEALDYWKRQLANAPPYLPLPYDRPRPAVQTPWGARRRLVISKAHSDTLRRLAQAEQTTLFVASLAAFKALLSRLSGDERLIVGTPSAYRHGPEMQTVLGFFLNQLALFSDLSGNPPFVEVVRRVKAVALGAYAHQEVPFGRVVEEVAPERDLSHTPLTQIVYLLLSPHQLGLAKISDLEAEPYWVDARRTQWDMTFSLWDYDTGLLGWMEYNTDLFDATTIDRMKEQFRQFLVAALEDPACPYWDLPLMTEGQRHQLLSEWGEGGAAGSESIGGRVARMAREIPEAPAVLSDLGELTFGELAARAGRLADHLAGLGVGAETIVGVCLPRSPELVVAILAVLEAGGAFLPLDPALPEGRLQLLLGEAKAPFVVTDRAHIDLLGTGDWQAVRIDELAKEPAGQGLGRCTPHPDQLAYVLFTSGSTGRPKGVMIPHRGLANYLAWCLAAYAPESGRGAPVHTSIGFDLTLTGLLAPLAVGRPVRFVAESLGADGLAQVLQGEQGWSLIKLTPAHLQVLALTPSVPLSRTPDPRTGRGGSPPPEAAIAGTLVVGGEALQAEQLAPFREAGLCIVNEYGPTEATVGCTTHTVSATDPETGPVSIGRPIDGASILILDRTGRPVPPGVHGELAIGGAGLARGYLGAPELTAARFTPHPEPSALGERLYRTGDRARFGAAGRLEFIGRLDSQIKLRGFRIEPAEVEEVLRRQPGIDDAAVGVVGERLVAWVVSAGRLDPKPLRAGLARSLPEAMIPADFVRLMALPRTPNGKLDKASLPVPGQERRAALYAAPRSFVEATLVEIWRETLRLPKVGIYDNFFDLGGHSLVAIQAMARLRKSLGVELRVQHLFEAPTVAKLARRIEEAEVVSRVPILPASPERRRRAVLSFAQQRLWFLDRLMGPSALYNMFFPLRLAGPLESEALAAAVGEIFRRHEVLRSTFVESTGGLPVQVVGGVPAAPLSRLDLEALPAATRETELSRLLDREVHRPFDLAADPLLRALLVELAPGDHALLLSLHHIASDGWSMGVLGYELGTLYAAFHKGWTSPLPELPLQYTDYAIWQRDQALDPSGLAVWREKLAGAPPEIALPLDRPRPRELSFRGRVAVRHLPAERMEGLREPAKKAQTTPFMTLLAAWAALLARTGGQSDLPLGTPAANRTRTEIEGLIGFFVNTVIVRADLSGPLRVADLLARVRGEVLWTFAHQEIPFERLVEDLAPERTLGRNPLTQVMFSLQSFPQEAPDLSGLAVTSLAGEGLDTGTSKFDLTLFVWGMEGEVRCVLEYNSDLFDAATAGRLLGGFERLLEGFAGDLSLPVAELPLMSEEERAEVLAMGAARQRAEAGRTLGDLFEEQAVRRPGAPALTFEGRHISYAELEGRSRRLAGHLVEIGVQLDQPVALFCDRTPEMIVAILAVLRAGGAYMPLDPQLPEERLRYLLEDCGTSLVVQGPGVELPEGLRRPGLTVLDLADLEPRLTDAGPQLPRLDPALTAYWIYTSGSTGNPKPVAIAHTQVVRMLSCTRELMGFGEDDVWTLFHSYAFDFSVWEIWGALLQGARLVIVPFLESRSPEAFARLLDEQRVTLLSQTPSAFNQLVAFEEQSGQPVGASLSCVIFGGEPLEVGRLEPWWRRHGGSPRLVNLYGPTETTVHATFHPVAPGESRGLGTNIGRPLADLSLHVLEVRGGLCLPGVVGELAIGGAGLALGYRGRPALTAERFVPDPFGTTPGARLYLSGDLGRLLSGGILEHWGRADRQVKIRGFRVEPGEIEAALAGHPGIAQAAVMLRGRDSNAAGEPRLVAYCVPHEGAAWGAHELRDFLSARLPAHMVPALYVQLPRLPLTANGKLDWKALPEPAGERPDLAARYEPPGSFGEETLAAVWSEALGIDAVGMRDNFFALGGDSIRALRVVSSARQRGLDLALTDLFEHQTIASLAAALEAGREVGVGEASAPFSLISPADRAALPEGVEDAYPVTQLQAGMLYHLELTPDYPLYHNVASFPTALPLDPDPGLFRRAVNDVVARHPILRTGFDMTSFSEPLQLVYRYAEMVVPVIDLRRLPGEAQEAVLGAFAVAEKHRLFDLARPPLLRFALHRLTDETVQFTLTENHAILDGWSLNSTLAECARRFLALRENPALPPEPPPPVLFRDYVRLEQAALADPAQKAFWEKELALATVAPLQRWGGERPAESPVSNRRTVVPAEILGRLRAVARELGLPQKSALLAVHLKVVAFLAGSTDALAGLVLHGRPEEPGGDQLRGLMLNTVPFRLELGQPTWRELVRAVFERERELLPHRRYPFAAVQRERGREPVYQTVFNHTNFHVWESLSADLEDDPEGFGEELEETEFPLIVNFNVGVTGRLRIALYTVLSDEQTDVVLGYYLRALEALATTPGADPRSAVLLSAEERAQVLVEWQGERPKVPAPLVHRRFEEQAWRQPEAPALVTGDGHTLSYSEVDALANALAAALAARGVGVEDRIGVCLEQGWEIPVVLLAILKAGACHLPLDPSYPAERLAFMLADSGAALVVTDGAAAGRLPAGTTNILSLDAGWERRLPAGIREEPAGMPALPADALAYVIYTSGSTGRPKGVAVPHRTLARLIDWQIEADGGFAGRTLQLSSPSFDVSLQEVLATWCAGAALVAASPELRRDPQRLLALLEAEGVERLFLPYVALQQLADAAAQGPAPRSLRRIVTAGEQLRATPEIRAFLAALPGAVLSNQYGPSETHVATEHLLSGEPAAWPELPPIGRPIAGTTTFVLDPWGSPAALGVPGELHLGGEGVARCYLGRPGLTAASFVPDALSGVPGGRLYKTGDRVRWMPTVSERGGGEIEFLGRVDSQVKVRGYRVEPGEIEAALTAHPEIVEAVVTVIGTEAAAKRLAAYVVARGLPPEAAELRRFLASRLPEPMVPEVYVHLPALPLTPSGKLDRRSLPEPGAAAAPEAKPADAPRDPLEAGLAAIWAEVLELPRVGREDGFFALGGHSLSASRAVSRVRRTFGVEAPLRALFEAPTPAAFAGVVRRALAAGQPVLPELAAQSRTGGPAPLSFAQQRLWFLARLEPDSPAYHMPFSFDLVGGLDTAALARSFSEIVRRHEVLRTVIAATDGRPVQTVLPVPEAVLTVVDLTTLSAPRRAGEAGVVQADLVLRPFRLDSLPPLRAALLRLDAEAHRAVVNVHHIACDGVSLSVLAREVGALYAAFSAGRPSPLPDFPLQYADYATWQRGWLQGEALDVLLAWWRGQLAGAPPMLELPTDRPRRAAGDRRAAVRAASLPAAAAALAADLGRRTGATPFMVFLAAWQALLGRAAGIDGVVVGTPVAGRNRAELEGLIGFFVNNLALYTDTSGTPGLAEMVVRAREVTLGALAHQELPFERLVEELAPARDLAVTPLFQVTLSVEATPIAAPELPGLALTPVAADPGRAKFDLDLTAVPEEDGALALSLTFDTDLYDAATIDRHLAQLVRLLEGGLADPAHPLTEIELLSPTERRQILEEWSGARVASQFAGSSLLPALFAERVGATPDALAVAWDGGGLSYGELGRRVESVAAGLAGRIAPETAVGVCLPPSPELVIAFWGVLAAGGVYLPLDPSYPHDRLANMIADAVREALTPSVPLSRTPTAPAPGEGEAPDRGLHLDLGKIVPTASPSPVSGEGTGERATAPIVLTRPDLAERLPAGTEPLFIEALVAEEAPGARAAGILPGQLAWIIFTSGSTGRPKGVGVPHAAAAAHLRQMAAYWQLGPEDRLFLTTSPSFDMSLEQLAPIALAGGTLLLRGDEALDPSRLTAELATLRATLADLPTAFWNAWLPEVELHAAELALRTAMVGGEALPAAAARRFLSGSFAHVTLLNGYGPTEAVISATFVPVTEELLGASPEAPLGRPLPGRTAYVVDASGRLSLPGAPGELQLGGELLARGYLGRPDETALRFVPDPWGGAAGARLYRTGDLTRFRTDGVLEFLGRIDRQVKIRGFRIELAEIEAVLLSHPEIREAAVVVWGDGPLERRLAAYLVPEEGAVAGEADERLAKLGTFLSARLPSYMVPASVTVLPALPRSTNGKLDRRALPRPEAAAGSVPPVGPTEEALAAIWAELLSLPAVGAEDNFFALGGHSLLAAQVTSRVRDRLGREVPLAELFERPTVRRLAAWLDEAQGEGRPAAAPIGRASRERFKVRRDDLGGGSPRGPV